MVTLGQAILSEYEWVLEGSACLAEFWRNQLLHHMDVSKWSEIINISPTWIFQKKTEFPLDFHYF